MRFPVADVGITCHTRTMDDPLHIPPLNAPARGTISVPGSKSINNRALLLAALADGSSTLTGALDSDDTRIFAGALKALGFVVSHDAQAQTFTVTGCCGALPDQAADLHVGNAGTAARFLLALGSLGHAPVRFDGVDAMRQRPMGGLLEALTAQGAMVSDNERPGYFPLTLNPNGLRGGTITMDPSRSSQLVSALLMVAPYATTDVTIRLTGEIVSEPYIAMTIAMMADWGVKVGRPDPATLLVPSGQVYRAKPAYGVEPDASSASYFFAAAAVSGGEVTVQGLTRRSLQGDVAFVDALAAMGATVTESANALTVKGPAQLTGARLDMNAISDTAPTLAAIAPFANGPVTITGVEHMRWKETDRIKAVVTELSRMGVPVQEHTDGMTIHPSRPRRVAVDTYDDHRMAMSFAITGLAGPGMDIKDPNCTSKTFPAFWDVLADLRAQSG